MSGSTLLQGNLTLYPLKLLMGKGKKQGGGHVPKAQGLKRCGWGLRPCNTEAARGI